MVDKTQGNRVVVVDELGNPTRLKNDREIVEENERLEASFKGKGGSKEKETKTKPKAKKNSKLDEVLKENKKIKEEIKKEDEDMVTMLVEDDSRSINIGTIGVGQAGNKIIEEFYNLGYDCVAINTAKQDLEHISIPQENKLLLEYALGGTAKDLSNGKEACNMYRDDIKQHIEKYLSDCDVLLLAISGGGGTGSGSSATMVDILSEFGTPIVVLYVLPLATDDSLSKRNAISSLSKLSKLTKDDIIDSLIIVDNSKIESILPQMPISRFWHESNKAIVKPLHLFNQLSSRPSEYNSLDPMDFGRILLSNGMTLYGVIAVDDYEDEESIPSAIINSLDNGLLCSGFDLKETRNAGIIITASKEILDSIPAANIEYGFSILNKVVGDGTMVFRGVYADENSDKLQIFTYFGGLGLPQKRIKELQAEADRHTKAFEAKKENRNVNMEIESADDFVDKTTEIHQKILNKKSGLGKLKKRTSVIDRRRR